MADDAAIPRVQTETEIIKSPISKCGDNWWKTIRIRSPYKSVNIAYRKLPPLGEAGQLERFDKDFVDELFGDLKRIASFVDEHIDELGDAQRANIDLMLSRALAYLEDAKAIQQTWATGFATTKVGDIPPWPLSHMEPASYIIPEVVEGHQRDSRRWKQLVRGAIRNLRCAEEIAKRATIRNHNRKIWEREHGARFGVIAEVTAGSRVTPPHPPGAPRGITLEELNEVDVDMEDEAPTAPKRKKDSTMVLLAAAGLGALALAKR